MGCGKILYENWSLNGLARYESWTESAMFYNQILGFIWYLSKRFCLEEMKIRGARRDLLPSCHLKIIFKNTFKRKFYKFSWFGHKNAEIPLIQFQGGGIIQKYTNKNMIILSKNGYFPRERFLDPPPPPPPSYQNSTWLLQKVH